MSLVSFYKHLKTPEINGRKIGLFRIVVAIVGGLLISYLAIILLAIIFPASKAQSLVVSLYLYTFVWACCILWIALSYTKFSALLKVFIPSTIFTIMILVLN